jgi:hypothetical protein
MDTPAQAATTITTQMLPVQIRAAQIEPATFDEGKRTVDVVFTTGAKVQRYDWRNDRYYEEELVVSEDAVDLTRMKAGASVLNTHGQYDLRDVIGVVADAWIDGAEGRATVRMSERPEVAGIVADVQAGVIRHISAGYSVQRMEMVAPESRDDGGAHWLYRATRWTPAEISFVPVPADAGSGTRSQPSQGGQPCEFITRAAAQTTQEETMPQAIEQGGTPTTAAASPAIEIRAAAPAAPVAEVVVDNSAALLARTAEISELCVRHGVPAMTADLIRQGADVATAKAAILDSLARDDRAAGGPRNAAPRIETVRDQMQVRLAGIEQAVMHRLTPVEKLDDNGKQYRGMSLLELGRDFLEAHNVNTRGMDKMKLAGAMLTHRSAGMHGTSDFASLFANVATKRLRNAYEENPGTYALWARRAPNAPDFKSINVVQMSGAPDLLKVNEAGEFTYGTVKDAGTSYGVVTYGRIVALTRQAIINDDLRAFDRLATAFGFAARRLENRLVYAQLTGADYSTDNGNLQTGVGSALQLESLKAARTAMRKQKGLNGEELNLAPAYLIVPAALEQTAYQLTSSNYVPATQANVNEFRSGGRTALEPIVEPVLDASSATAWYAAASNAAVDTVEYCYLDGAEGPVVESKNGWEVDGVEYKCRLDFAAKAVDHRGLHKSAGA